MVAIIAAYSQNRVIGRNGRIPWQIKGEQLRFRNLTLGNAVIMGRRTFEEIGHPLPGRLTVVVSRTKCFTGENCLTAHSLSEAIALAGQRDIYIAGGEQLYREAMSLAQKLYIPEIEAFVEGDAFFPHFDGSLFCKKIEECRQDTIPYAYVTYTRKSTGQQRASEV